MQKKNSNGFMLAETLIVTIFVAGVLIFLFIQFSSLSKSYEESYIYNTVEGLYSLNGFNNLLKEKNISIYLIELIYDIINNKKESKEILNYIIREA